MNILTVRKKPIQVKAMRFIGGPENLQELFDWSNGQVTEKDPNTIYVQALEARTETPLGSYVVMGIKGEVWPVREDIFNETYEIIYE